MSRTDTPEQQARDMLERLGMEDAQSLPSGAVVEIANLIARVRADERERWGLGWIAAADNVQALAHAEAVAAKLVEVICESETFRRNSTWEFGVVYGQLAAVEADLAAARAERLEALQKVAALDDQLAAARAEVAALREEVAHAWAVANGEARR